MEQLTFLQGRLCRCNYGIQLIIILIPLELVHPPVDPENWMHSGLIALLIVVCTGSTALLSVRRFHDLGLSGWYALALVVPILNLPALLLLLLLPGKPSHNRWGLVPVPYPHPTIPQITMSGLRLQMPSRVRA
ncbi:DUF805 domain-containing protein [Hymenobacter sp.]|jgi:uncharacterized membrane protein YhaH (DUF805 family)|uniref:DUF805 domain-containing protein n=1 Tax=Hymenobacter sp. TaxID=1898978 RepID=UPI0039C88839